MGKEPWLAFILSFTIPGVGHVYANRIGRGIVFHLLALFTVALFIGACTNPHMDIRLALVGGILFWPVWIYNAIDAFLCTRRDNSAAFEAARAQSKDPWLAVWLSQILPGAGLLYLRQWGAFVLSLFFMGLFTYAAMHFLEPHVHALVVDTVLSLATIAIIFWTYMKAPLHREGSPKTILILLLFLFLHSLAMRSCLYFSKEHIVTTYRITGGSMAPALKADDRIMVDKAYESIRRGDIAVFISKTDPNVIYIKRVAALAGETIEFRDDGRVYIDDKVLDSPPFDRLRFYKKDYLGTIGYGEPHRVPKNAIFVLGDHGQTSLDSRKYGDIQLSSVRGIAYRIWFPLKRAGAIDSSGVEYETGDASALDAAP